MSTYNRNHFKWTLKKWDPEKNELVVVDSGELKTQILHAAKMDASKESGFGDGYWLDMLNGTSIKYTKEAFKDADITKEDRLELTRGPRYGR